jgi:hypothetical protein
MGSGAFRFTVRALSAVGICVLTAGCAAQAPRKSIEDVIAHIDSLDGKTVSVAGYLGKCAGYDCLLFSSRGDEHAYSQGMAKMTAMHAAGQRVAPTDLPRLKYLGIGSAGDFDRKAAALVNGYVLITGKVTDRCREPGGEAGCTDRTADIVPSDIVAWQPPGNVEKTAPTS